MRNIESLELICANLREALRVKLLPEDYELAEHYGNARVALELKLPPGEVWAGQDKTSLVVRSYLQWSGEPTEVRRIAADLWRAGWRSGNRNDPALVLKSVNAAIRAHRDGLNLGDAKPRELIFRIASSSVDPSLDLVSLIEWDLSEQANTQS